MEDGEDEELRGKKKRPLKKQKRRRNNERPRGCSSSSHERHALMRWEREKAGPG